MTAGERKRQKDPHKAGGKSVQINPICDKRGIFSDLGMRYHWGYSNYSD